MIDGSEMFASILNEISGQQQPAAAIESEILQDIFAHLEAGTVRTALSLIPQLDAVEYEQNRQRIAELANIRPSALDDLRRRAQKAESDNLQGRRLILEPPEPAAEPQNGVQLLNDAAMQIRRFVAADAASIDAIALWAAFTHLADKAQVCPILAITSATKACGKSTCLEVVSRLVPKPISSANITAAALFRVVEAAQPTLLVDEADVLFRQNDELRCLLNSGFTRAAAQAIRVEGDGHEVRIFSTWAPKAIALIGSLPDTMESRSVVIRMRRRLPDETIERLRADCDQGFDALRSRIARFALDNAQAILAHDPEMPESLSDRQADVWRELIRIADTVGGDWPERARRAALELCARQDDEGDLSIRLLADLQTIMNELPERDKWPSQALVDALNALDEAPWADLARGKGLTTNRLARMLARFGISAKKLRTGSHTANGYLTADFMDAFQRYLPQKRNTGTLCDNSLPDNEIKCSTFVPVPLSKRNISTERLALASQIAGKLLEVSPTVPLAQWRQECVRQGLSDDEITQAETYMLELGLLQNGTIQFA